MRTGPLFTALVAVTAACTPTPTPRPRVAPAWAPPPAYAPPPAAPPVGPAPPTAAPPPPGPPPAPVTRPAPYQQGKASYYADSLAGNSTASGEPYDPRAISAAHRTLPFGTIVDVVRGDGRWVRVRINDRGPFAKGRVIDLSRAAAEAIGMIQAGVVDVTLYVIQQP